MSFALWVNTQFFFLPVATAFFQGLFYAAAEGDFLNPWQLYDSCRISVLVFFLSLFPAESQGIFI